MSLEHLNSVLTFICIQLNFLILLTYSCCRAATRLSLSFPWYFQASVFKKNILQTLINDRPDSARQTALRRLSAKNKTPEMLRGVKSVSLCGMESVCTLRFLARRRVCCSDTVIGPNEPLSREMMCGLDVVLILMAEVKVATTTHQTTQRTELPPEGGRDQLITDCWFNGN